MSSNHKSLTISKAENYLLGTLTAAEALDFECEVFPDENLSEQLDVLRHELAEKYICDELDEKQKIYFKDYFLSFPYNSEIFTFQKSIIKEAKDRASEPELAAGAVPVVSQREEKTGLLAKLSETFTFKVFAIPAFAALLIAVFGGIIFYNSRKGEEVAIKVTPTPSPNRDVNIALSPVPPLTPPENNINSNSNLSTKENNQNKTTVPATPTPKNEVPQAKSPIFATVLLIGKFRVVGTEEKPVIIGKETEKVNLEFHFPKEDSDAPVKNYKLILETVAGSKIWEEFLPKGLKKSGERLKEDVSPDLFQSGQYRFRMVGVSQDNREKTVQSQTFFVKRIS